MGEYIEVSKKALGRIRNGIKTTVGLSVLIGLTLIAIFVGEFALLKGSWAYGSILLVMGIITEIFIAGYMVENYHDIQKNKKLPKLIDKIGEKFAWGILSIIIAFVYMIPAIITQLVLYNTIGRTLLTMSITTIVTFIFAFPAIAGVIEFSKKMKFKDAFTKEVCKNAYKPRFIGYTILGYIIGYLIMLGLLITIVGWFVFGAIGMLYIQHMVVAGYTQKKSKKRTSKKKTVKRRKRRKK